jgi:hypothetical protein
MPPCFFVVRRFSQAFADFFICVNPTNLWIKFPWKEFYRGQDARAPLGGRIDWQ